jgi:hypothetical protein
MKFDDTQEGCNITEKWDRFDIDNQEGCTAETAKKLPSNMIMHMMCTSRSSSDNSSDCGRNSIRYLDTISEGDGSSNCHSNGLSSTSASTSTSFSSSTSSSSSLPSSVLDSSDDSDETNSLMDVNEALYKPIFYSPMDLLDTVTNHVTSRDDSLDGLFQLHTWTIEATGEEIDLYTDQIKMEAVPELLEFVRTHIGDNEVVHETLKILRRFAFHEKLTPKVFVECDAINILVLALEFYHTDDDCPNDPDNSYCLLRTIWNFLAYIVLHPTVFDILQRRRGDGNDTQQRDLRIKLVTAVDLCLERRIGYAMSLPWMGQMFDILNILLRTTTHGSGDDHVSFYDDENKIEPDDDIRVLLSKKHIGRKCQYLLVANDHSHLFEYEKVPIGAISFFYFCLLDRDDGLSKSLDKRILSKFVRKNLNKFPMSGLIQGMGCHILTQLAKELLQSSSSSESSLLCSLPPQQEQNYDDRSFSLIIGESFGAKLIYKAPWDSPNRSNGAVNKNDNATAMRDDHEKKKKSRTISSIFTSIFSEPCSCEDHTW